MKWWLVGLGLFIEVVGNTQSTFSFASIDKQVNGVEASTPDSLSRLLTKNYFSEVEKVRAIFSWITTHISYNTAIYKPALAAYKPFHDPIDTAAVWPTGDEMIARKILQRRVAVCDGYSRLFKVLCYYAHIDAVVIQGYGRSNATGDKRFRTNHTWNAVRIDSAWHLVDVTWASGYTDFANEFTARQNDFYFLTPPEQFVEDHYPEQLKWTLLTDPPQLNEFKKMPFRSKNFFKYGAAAYLPESGIVEANIGDTITFLLQLKDVARAKATSADPFMDTASYSEWPKSVFCKPVS